MSKIKTISEYADIKKIREALDFNKNVISISFEEKYHSLTFKFWNNSYTNPSGRSIDYFEISKNSCDMNAFDEFVDQCIEGFNSLSMTDNEIFAKANEVYRITARAFQKQAQFQKLLSQTQKGVRARVHRALDILIPARNGVLVRCNSLVH